MSTQQIQGPQAVDLSPEQEQVAAERAYALNENIKAGLRAGRLAFWQTAEPMVEFDEMRGWLALGYEHVTDWLADPDIQMTRSTYYRAVSSFKYLVGKGVTTEDMADLEVSKVDIVLPKVKRGETTLRKALADARSLGQRDLREEYLGAPDRTPIEAPIDGNPQPGDLDYSNGDIEGHATEVPVDDDFAEAFTDDPGEFETGPTAAEKVSEFLITHTTVEASQARKWAPGLVDAIGARSTSNGEHAATEEDLKLAAWARKIHDDEKAFGRLATVYRKEYEEIVGTG